MDLVEAATARPGFGFHGSLPGGPGASAAAATARQPRPALVHRKQSGFSVPTSSPVCQSSTTSSLESSSPLPASPVPGQHGTVGGRSALSHLMLQLSTPPMRMPLASPAPGGVPLSHIMQPHPPSPSDFFNFSTAAESAEKETGHGADAPADYFSSRSCTRAADAQARSASDAVSEARMGPVSAASTSSFAPSSVDSLTFTDSTSSPSPSPCSPPNTVSRSSASHPFSHGKGALPAADLSEATEEAAQRQFLNREELLSLSPYQTSILQEAHAEARRRAMAMERAEQEQGHGDGAADADGFRSMIDIEQGKLSDGNVTQAHRLVVIPASTSPFDSAFNAMLLTSPQPENREHFDGMAAAADTAVNSSILSNPASTTSALPSGLPAITCPAPQADFYKATSGNASQRAKQLGTFPADEAFATSLEQLTAGRVDRNAKPTCLWWSLIRAAILGSPERRLQMETLCATISEHFPYFGRAKEAKNWKSSIRSVIHTKPCFYKTEDAATGAVWWHVDVAIDPREQRRGLKKRSSVSSGGDEAEGSSEARKRARTAVQEAMSMSGTGAAFRGEIEEAEASASEVDVERERRATLRAHSSSKQRKRRRKTQ